MRPLDSRRSGQGAQVALAARQRRHAGGDHAAEKLASAEMHGAKSTEVLRQSQCPTTCISQVKTFS